MEMFFHSLSQVFFIKNRYAGFFLLAIGYEAIISHTPSLVFAVLLGNILSNELAIYYKYNREHIESGLYGFNGILTAMSVVLYIKTILLCGLY